MIRKSEARFVFADATGLKSKTFIERGQNTTLVNPAPVPAQLELIAQRLREAENWDDEIANVAFFLAGDLNSGAVDSFDAVSLICEIAEERSLNRVKVAEDFRRACQAVLAGRAVRGIGTDQTAVTPEQRPRLESEKIVTQWPDPPGNAAYYGLAGDLVRAIEPHTEADPAALLVQFLSAFGNVIGRNSYFVAEDDKHFLNLFAVLVGNTSKGRKGTSWGRIRSLLGSVDADWLDNCLQSGLSSGEGLIWAVRDPIEKTEPIRDKRTITGYRNVITDPGIEDKRLLVVESEFASAIKSAAREGNTLSAVIRDAWDRGCLRSMVKNSPARASNAHVSIIGHITKDELRRYLDSTETANGFANRFLWGLRAPVEVSAGRRQA